MDEEKVLIIAKGEDKTSQIEHISQNGKKLEIKFKSNEKIYFYTLADVVIEKSLEIIDVKEKDIYYKNQIIFNVKKAIKFRNYTKITYNSGDTGIFRNNDISCKSINSSDLNKNVIEYFREISKYVKNIDEEKQEERKNQKESFLKREYEKLNYINKESVLDYYINKKSLVKLTKEDKNIIYPFRFNLSQKQAVENAFKSNISVIEGPPGTGKTQTILNIIANLAIMQKKTVAVVSNNNEAVKNVKDKLKKDKYDFIVADLGRKAKREQFFENVPQPEVEHFQSTKEEDLLLKQIEELNNKLNDLLEKNNQKAELEKEIEDYNLEQKYFEDYYKNQDIKKIEKLSFYNKTDDRILEFLLDSQMLHEKRIKLEWLYKIKLLFKYRIKNLEELDKNLVENILNLQKEYYEIKIKKLEEEYSKLEKKLENSNFEELQKKHKEISEIVFKNRLYERYAGKRNSFNLKNYKKNIEKFLQAYPIVISTTYSLRNCVPNDFMFDYVIVDESSQVDLLTGSLALSCAKNAIIVGDTKQLPQIVDNSIKEKISNSDIDICHDYFQNSLLSAILKTYGKKFQKRF